MVKIQARNLVRLGSKLGRALIARAQTSWTTSWGSRCGLSQGLTRRLAPCEDGRGQALVELGEDLRAPALGRHGQVEGLGRRGFGLGIRVHGPLLYEMGN